MRMDKKAVGGSLRFIVLQGPGRAAVRGVDEAIVAATIEAFQDRGRPGSGGKAAGGTGPARPA
jgi:hypothetical protein